MSSSNLSRAAGAAKKVNPLSYPKSTEAFSSKLFKSPTAEYRGCPLWSWNAKLDIPQLLRQIDYLEEMGMGGFHVHPRTGLDTEYLSPEFMDCVKACVDYAEKKGMLACLYDEDRWPSGTAGGKITKEHPEHKTKHILFTVHPYGTVDLVGCSPSSAGPCRSENGYLLAKYAVRLDKQGKLQWSARLKENEVCPKDAVQWYAYVESNPPSAWFNDQTYIDTLSKPAMQQFIKTTHEVYKEKIGDSFGSTVPCIFTDEPQFAMKSLLPYPEADNDMFLPWTEDFPSTFRQAYGQTADILENLCELVWNLPDGKSSVTRYRWHDHVCERFVTAFMDQLGDWCTKNSIYLNGHMMMEETLYSQTTAVGEVMRCYRSQTLPGMDLLNDGIEYNTAKQVSSMARQMGSRGAMSEIYGCTHWDFTFEGHKGCGDWQAACGITFRVQHLAWQSMRGEAKRDYPASINYQSPWYREYGHIEDHFARVGVAMTRGHAVARVAVIHPIESYWMAFGPNGGGENEKEWRDNAFGDLTSWLLHGLIDFDFICESNLPRQFNGVSEKDKQLLVGECKYDVVVLPNLHTIRSTTVKVLAGFARVGGKIIIAGSTASLVNGGGLPNYPVGKFLDSISDNVEWEREKILAKLIDYRELLITSEGKPSERLLYQMRQDGDDRFVFVCNEDRKNGVRTIVDLKGAWTVEKMDTFTGEISKLKTRVTANLTSFPYKFEGCASLLIRMSPLRSSQAVLLPQLAPPSLTTTIVKEQPVQLNRVVLNESNVLLLDYASYSFDGEPWTPPVEILRIDNEIRARLHLPSKNAAFRQPWTLSPEQRKPTNKLSLWFTFYSELDLERETRLAVEDPDTTDFYINFQEVKPPRERRGWWVDEHIKTLPIPAGTIKKGINYLHAYLPFGILTNLERIYILGDFKLRVDGHVPTLLPVLSQRISWGDIAQQGVPFYVGNVTYRCSFTVPESSSSGSEKKKKAKVTLSVPQFSSPVLTVKGHKEDKEEKEHIALQPHKLYLGELESGSHDIEITAYGNRYNSFGHIHTPAWVGGCWPDRWRTGGNEWSDDYVTRPIGVLECPTVIMEVEDDDKSPAATLDDEPPASPEWVLVDRTGSHPVTWASGSESD